MKVNVQRKLAIFRCSRNVRWHSLVMAAQSRWLSGWTSHWEPFPDGRSLWRRTLRWPRDGV